MLTCNLRLELGAGGGLVGLAVALECKLQSRMLVTDQLQMLELMQHNIKLNQLGSKAQAMILNWCVSPCNSSPCCIRKPCARSMSWLDRRNGSLMMPVCILGVSLSLRQYWSRNPMLSWPANAFTSNRPSRS